MKLTIGAAPSWWIENQSNAGTISLWWDGRAWKDLTPDLLVSHGGGLTGSMTQSPILHETINYVGYASEKIVTGFYDEAVNILGVIPWT